jgi:hypothetical protein
MKKATRIKFQNGAEVKAETPQDESAATKLIALAQAEPDLFHDVMATAMRPSGSMAITRRC